MIPPAESLLKYDNPVLVSKSSRVTSPKVRPQLHSQPQQSLDTSPVPPPPKQKADSSEHEDILNSILPPRMDGGNPTDVLQLTEQLDEKLQERQARLTGICPIRREIYSQCFDELIRQVTINCAERGLLLLRVREEINMTIAAYQTLYESSVAFGMRKALLSEHGTADMEKRVGLEKEKQDLIKQLNEQKRRQAEEKKLNEEINFLKRTNQQLKVLINVLSSIHTK
uniref:Axonemal dynein light intermediate polypeptide 1 n=1 Tax=Neogobius melanostomus TaxID=47308 RepID=A0A8C6UTP8_9GOBI